MAQFGIILAIVLYLGLMIGIGYYFSRNSEKSAEGFFLGGRKLGPLVAAMSAEASDMSSWLLMGLPGVAYITGLADAAWTAIGLGIGTYLNWLIVAKRLRRYSIKLGAITVPDFFSKRYNDEKNILMFIAAVIILIFFIPYTASGFKAVGTLFSTLIGVDYHVAMVVGAIVIVGYTVMGGFMAVSTTDLIQSVVMSIALLIIVMFGISTAGGWANVMANAQSLTGYLSLTSIYDMASGTASSYGFITICSTMAWGLGYFGMPHILLRFMAIEDPEKMKVSRRVGTVWVFIAMGVAVLIGIVAKAMVSLGAMEALEDPERAVIGIAQLMAKLGVLPGLMAGVVLAGILACTMSTCDSQLLAAASSISENLLQGVMGMKLSQKQTMVMARATLVVIALIGVVLARDPNSSVFTIVSFAWAGFGGAFGPVMLCALFWKRCNRQGAIAGMLGGGAMIFLWKFLIKPMGGVFGIYELLPGFLVGLALCVAVSLATPAPEEGIAAEFDEAARQSR